MSKSIEKTGKTVEEAIKEALKELNLTREEIDVEILEEGSKRMLGIIGGKDAAIRATVIEKGAEIAEGFLVRILNLMEIEADIYIEEGQDLISVNISGDDIGILIGRRGETLDAVQYLTGLTVNRNSSEYKRVTVDVENYRAKREDALKKVAIKAAVRVIKTRKSFKLEPMNPFERRIIHSELQKNKKIETYSVGEEPNRRVVIALKK
jgi:spoIIIJ-associated protein